MKKSEINVFKFPCPFAFAGDRSDIPVLPANDKEASIREGYNPKTSSAIDDGGMPVTRETMNGVLYKATINQHAELAGTNLNIYDASYATSIGGYPQDAVVKIYNNDGSYTIYKSLIDDNTYSPAVDNGTHWAIIRNYNNLYKDLSNLELDGFKKMLEINRVSNCIIKGEVDVVYEDNKLILKIKAGTILAYPNGIKNNSAEYDNIYRNISDDLNIDITNDYINYMTSGICYFIFFISDGARTDTSVNYFHGELPNNINNRYIFSYSPNNNIVYNLGIRASNTVFLGYLSVNKDNNSIIYKKINYINTKSYQFLANYDFAFIFLSGFGGNTNFIKINSYGKYVVRVVNANYLYVNLYRFDDSSSTLINVYRTGANNISELTLEVEIKEPYFGIMVLTDAQADVNNYIKFIPYLN